MSKYSVNIIGCGSMGEALAIGWQGFGQDKVKLAISVKHQFQADKMQELGVPSVFNLQELPACDMLIVAVRPEQMIETIQEYMQLFAEQPPKVLISVAAGMTLETLRSCTPKNVPVARIMPNSPVTIGQGLLGFCHEKSLSPELIRMVNEVWSSIGDVVSFDESLMNAFTALAGCGPGFHYHIMDSFVEAGVTVGLGREQATVIAAGLMRSCGSVVQSQKMHPAILRELSCAPRSMTIRGLNYMDSVGMRGQVITTVKEAFERGLEMEKE